MRETQRLSIVCWATTGNVAPERIPERIDDRNTKVVYRLLGYNRNRFPRENPERNTKVVCLAATGNDSPERKPDRIDER